MAQQERRINISLLSGSFLLDIVLIYFESVVVEMTLTIMTCYLLSLLLESMALKYNLSKLSNIVNFRE